MNVVVVAVSYLNTVPFIYGIQQAAPLWLRAALTLAIPAQCADSLINRLADVALVPVAEIPRIENGCIITDFCISAEGAVDTVVLLSDTPLNQIHTVYLDAHSRTSVKLVKVLAAEKWGVSPVWIDGIPQQIEQGEAVVAIGDKVFEIAPKFRYKTDLALEWQEMTGLPFVFAVWVARTPQGMSIEQELNKALAFGVDHIAQSIPSNYDYDKAYKYLTENIQFRLDEPKRAAIRLFWEKIITPG